MGTMPFPPDSIILYAQEEYKKSLALLEKMDDDWIFWAPNNDHPLLLSGELPDGYIDSLIKKAEKYGTKHARHSALDGIPKHLPALLRAEKLVKKARKAGLTESPAGRRGRTAQTSSPKKQGRAAARPYQKKFSKTALANELFTLAELAQTHGWSAEELLCVETSSASAGFGNRNGGICRLNLSRTISFSRLPDDIPKSRRAGLRGGRKWLRAWRNGWPGPCRF